MGHGAGGVGLDRLLEAADRLLVVERVAPDEAAVEPEAVRLRRRSTPLGRVARGRSSQPKTTSKSRSSCPGCKRIVTATAGARRWDEREAARLAKTSSTSTWPPPGVGRAYPGTGLPRARDAPARSPRHERTPTPLHAPTGGVCLRRAATSALRAFLPLFPGGARPLHACRNTTQHSTLMSAEVDGLVSAATRAEKWAGEPLLRARRESRRGSRSRLGAPPRARRGTRRDGRGASYAVARLEGEFRA